MYDAEVKPLKGTGTRWTNFEVHKMYRLVEKFGLYVGHLNEVEAKTCKSTDRAALQGQITKLMDAKALLRWAFFTGVLAETEHFSMVTQRKSINIIKVFYAVETAKSNYERLLNKVKKKKSCLQIRITKYQTGCWFNWIQWRWREFLSRPKTELSFKRKMISRRSRRVYHRINYWFFWGVLR